MMGQSALVAVREDAPADTFLSHEPSNGCDPALMANGLVVSIWHPWPVEREYEALDNLRHTP